jgi:2-methylcitrate dehydratase PrpD
LARSDIHQLADRITIDEEEQMNAVFPAQRLARLTITDKTGNRRISAVVSARGDPETPLSDSEIVDKFYFLMSLSHKASSAESIAKACQNLAEQKEGLQECLGDLLI